MAETIADVAGFMRGLMREPHTPFVFVRPSPRKELRDGTVSLHAVGLAPTGNIHLEFLVPAAAPFLQSDIRAKAVPFSQRDPQGKRVPAPRELGAAATARTGVRTRPKKSGAPGASFLRLARNK